MIIIGVISFKLFKEHPFRGEQIIPRDEGNGDWKMFHVPISTDMRDAGHGAEVSSQAVSGRIKTLYVQLWLIKSNFREILES